MPKYPESVITIDKKGNREVRLLVDKGKFVRYQYMDPETGKIVKQGKSSIMLENKEGKKEHLFLIPMKGGRFLLLMPKDADKPRKVWDSKAKKEVSLF